MASKAFEQICKFLDGKELQYGIDGEDTARQRIFFRVTGAVVQTILFVIEEETHMVHFRSIQILDEDDLKNYHEKPENRVKLFEYLLKWNYEYKLGKFALNPEDDVDLQFVISDYVEVEKGIEKEFLERVDAMLFGPSFAASNVEKAIKDIKSILATGEKSEDVDTLEAMAQKLADEDPEFAKRLEELRGGSDKKSSQDDEFEDGI